MAVIRLQRWADTNVTLPFENAQVIPPFSREETFLGHNLNISGAYQGHFWDILGIYIKTFVFDLFRTFQKLSRCFLKLFKDFSKVFRDFSKLSWDIPKTFSRLSKSVPHGATNIVS